MSTGISMSLRPFVSHQAVSTVLVIENSCAMASDWPNVRDRYVRSMIETLKAGNATVPTDFTVLPTLPLDVEHSSTATGLQPYNNLRDFQFNHRPENRINADHIHRAIDYLTASDYGKQSSTVRHIFIVAATAPSDTLSALVGPENDRRPAWQNLAQRLTETHIYHHLIAKAGQDMAPLMNLFEETLRLQGNIENKVQVTWRAPNAPLYFVRLASRTQVQISATTSPRTRTTHETASAKGKEIATHSSNTTREGSPTESSRAAGTSMASVSRGSEVSEAPTLVAHLQHIHGLVKKKIHIVPPPREPFFRNEPVNTSLHSDTSLSTLSPLERSEGGRVEPHFKSERSSRIRDHPSRRRSRSSKSRTSSEDLSLPSPLESNQEMTRQKKQLKPRCITRPPPNHERFEILDYRSPSTGTSVSSPLSPTVTDALDAVSLHSSSSGFSPGNDALSAQLLTRGRTVVLPVPPRPTRSPASSAPSVTTSYADASKPHAHRPTDNPGLAYLDLPGASTGPTSIGQLDLSTMLDNEEFIRKTKSIMAKMTPDYSSILDNRGKVELPIPPWPNRRRASTISSFPTPTPFITTSIVQTPSAPTTNTENPPPPPSDVPIITIPPVESGASAPKSPSTEHDDPRLTDSTYWRDMSLLFGPNNPTFEVEGLPSYAIVEGDEVVTGFNANSYLFDANFLSAQFPNSLQQQPINYADLTNLDDVILPPSYTPATMFSPSDAPGLSSDNFMPFLDMLQTQPPPGPAPSYQFPDVRNTDNNNPADNFIQWTPEDHQ